MSRVASYSPSVFLRPFFGGLEIVQTLFLTLVIGRRLFLSKQFSDEQPLVQSWFADQNWQEALFLYIVFDECVQH